jgi:hypothetical protein
MPILAEENESEHAAANGLHFVADLLLLLPGGFHIFLLALLEDLVLVFPRLFGSKTSARVTE